MHPAPPANYFKPAQPSDFRNINGHKIDITTQEGNLYGDLWGHKAKDQQVRRQELAHLDSVAGDGFDYNLEDPGQCEQFMRDILDGKLDGQVGKQDGSVLVDGATIRVGNNAATYDLRDPASYARMRADNADGRLDGTFGGEPPAAAKMAIETPQPQRAAAAEPAVQAEPRSTPASQPATAPAPTPVAAPAEKTAAKDSSGDKKTDALIAKVNSTTPQELIRQMLNGELSEDIMANPQAMQALQLKLNQFNQMITMISNMMKAHHETMMAIIANLRP